MSSSTTTPAVTSSSPLVQHLMTTKERRYDGDVEQQQNEPEIIIAEQVEPVVTPTANAPHLAKDGAVGSSTLTSSNTTTNQTDEFDCILCGDTKIRGSSIKIGRNTFISLCGNTIIDMREISLPDGTSSDHHFHFIIVRLCGDVKLYVNRGWNVSLCRVSMCGDKDMNIDDDNNSDIEQQQNTTTVRLTVVMLCGSIQVMN